MNDHRNSIPGASEPDHGQPEAVGAGGGWIDESLGEYFEPYTEELKAPSPGFAERCQEAAARGLEIARMHRVRPDVAGAPGSLSDHFAALARLAGVRLDRVLSFAGIHHAEQPDAESARGMGRLARMLGLQAKEAVLRLRLGFARDVTSSESCELTAALQPALARHRPDRPQLELESLLHACELRYAAERKKRLADAVAALEAGFGPEEGMDSEASKTRHAP